MTAVAGLTTLETAVIFAAGYVGLVLMIFGPMIFRAGGPKLPPARARPEWIAELDHERQARRERAEELQARWERVLAATRARSGNVDNVVPLHRKDRA